MEIYERNIGLSLPHLAGAKQVKILPEMTVDSPEVDHWRAFWSDLSGTRAAENCPGK